MTGGSIEASWYSAVVPGPVATSVPAGFERCRAERETKGCPGGGTDCLGNWMGEVRSAGCGDRLYQVDLRSALEIVQLKLN